MTQGDSPSVVELEFALGERQVTFVLDDAIYPRDAVFGAAYLFVDRCYLFFEIPSEGKTAVRIRARGEATEAQLEALAGDFANELLNQVVRGRISASTSKIREYYMARAFFTSDTQSTIDQLLAELDEEEMADDDLEVSVPWASEDGGADAASADSADSAEASDGDSEGAEASAEASEPKEAAAASSTSEAQQGA